MKIIWIGDQRSKQLKYWQEIDEAQQTDATEEDGTPTREFEFILNDEADSAWFSSFGAKKASNLMDKDAVIVVNLGLNDCINSCLWDSYSILDIAKEYVSELDFLVDQCVNGTVYVCSVTPVNTLIPRTEAQNGYVARDAVNNKIVELNRYIQDNSKATVIDCYHYLTSTSYATRDGMLYTADTSVHLLNFILGHLKTVTTRFPARLDTNPPTLDGTAEEDKYWTLTRAGGLNVFDVSGNKNVPYEGCALPNCTAYAWGRFYELTGEKPKLYTGNAETWYGAGCSLTLDLKTQVEKGTAYDGYSRGETPKEGAIICWEGIGGAAGHVAVVEKVNPDGSIITSESGWQSASIWWTKERNNSNGNWGAGTSSYRFLGFIYCPSVTAMGPTVSVKKSDVVVKSSGLSRSEMEINSMYIWNYLGGHKDDPWTLNAVAGILGNMEKESSINPGRHETSGSGFGLVQWTPKSKYTNWLATSEFSSLPEDDIDGQLERIIWEKNNGKQYGKNHYKYTFKEFAVSTDSAYELACAFAFDYERSAVTIWGFHTDSLSRKSVYCSKSTYDSNCEEKCKACRPCYKAKFGEARTAQQMERNRQQLRDARGNAAEEWFKFLLPFAPGACFEEKFAVHNLKIDNCTTTSIDASFIASKAKSGKSKILDKDDKTVSNSQLSVTANEEETFAIVSFRHTGLVPNTEYKLVVDVDSELDEESVSQVIEFTTKQSYPKLANIVLAPKDAAASTRSDEFIATWSALSDSEWGYWRRNNHGFKIHFLKNGHEINSQTVNSSTNSFTFKPSERFEDIKLDDTIQLGISSWTKDNDGNTIFSENSSIASTSIKFLEQPIKVFLGAQ